MIDRQTGRQSGRERERQRERERERETETERDRERDSQTDRQRDRDRERQRETETDRQEGRQEHKTSSWPEHSLCISRLLPGILLLNIFYSIFVFPVHSPSFVCVSHSYTSLDSDGSGSLAHDQGARGGSGVWVGA